MVCGSEDIKRTIEKHLLIQVGWLLLFDWSVSDFLLFPFFLFFIRLCFCLGGRDHSGRAVHAARGGVSGLLCQRAHGAGK